MTDHHWIVTFSFSKVLVVVTNLHLTMVTSWHSQTTIKEDRILCDALMQSKTTTKRISTTWWRWFGNLYKSTSPGDFKTWISSKPHCIESVYDSTNDCVGSVDFDLVSVLVSSPHHIAREFIVHQKIQRQTIFGGPTKYSSTPWAPHHVNDATNL